MSTRLRSGQRKAFSRQIITESKSERKETADIEILEERVNLPRE